MTVINLYAKQKLNHIKNLPKDHAPANVPFHPTDTLISVLHYGTVVLGSFAYALKSNFKQNFHHLLLSNFLSFHQKLLLFKINFKFLQIQKNKKERLVEDVIPFLLQSKT